VARDDPISVEVYGFVADALRNKYGYPYSSLSRRQDIPITEEASGAHSVELFIGTDPQGFRVVPDTGSVDLWVTGYERTASSTYADVTDPDRATITYGAGTVTGDVVSDTVTFGDYTVAGQRFLVGEDISSPPTPPVTGNLGLPPIAATSAFGATPFWETVHESNPGLDSAMSFKFPPLRTGSREAREVLPTGTLTVAGRNDSLFTGDLEFLPLVSTNGVKDRWLLNVAGITVGGQNVDLPPNGMASIDTSAPLIGGPTDAVSAIYAKVPGSKPLDGQFAGFYGFPCNSKVEITISFGGKFWPIDPREINLGPVPHDPALCVGAIFDLNGSSKPEDKPDWVIGVTFLRGVYSVFCLEPPLIAFAQLA
jgi:cathepsin D